MIGVVQVEDPAGGPADLGNRVSHRALHPHAQHIELKKAQVFDILLVRLQHRVAGRGGLHGDALQQ